MSDSERGHRYRFGFSSAGACSLCGSSAHWTLHCPERVKVEGDGSGS